MMSRRAVTILALVTPFLISWYGCTPTGPGASSDDGGVPAVVGHRLPDVMLQSADGSAFHLAGQAADGPLLLVVVTAEDCLGCGDYVKELRILQRTFPDLRGFLVGVGRDTTFFSTYVRRQRFARHGLLDPESAMLAAIGRSATPFIVILDTTNTVVFYDPREAAEAALLPISRLLPGLADILGSVEESEARASASGGASSPNTDRRSR